MTTTDKAVEALEAEGLTEEEEATDDVLDPGTESVMVTDERKVTWGYTRKFNLGNYESQEVSLYATDMVPSAEGIPHFIITRSESMFDMLKVEVWGALGIDFSYTSAGKPTLDRPEPAPTAPPPHYPNPRDPQQVGAGRPPAQPQTPPVHNERAAQQRRADPPQMAQVGVHAPMPDFCKECGQREFWDNRAEVDDRMQKGMTCTPDWVCKNRDCKKGYFRPGSYDYNQAIKKRAGSTGPTPTAPPAPVAQGYGPDEEPFA